MTKFDHEYSDDELYRKYSLTEKEIKIIEDTLAERSLEEVYSWINNK